MKHLIFMTLTMLVALTGCAPREERSWVELVERLAEPSFMARLDCEPTHIVTSYDRSGKNDDYNQFEKDGPAGWEILADIKGPGYLSRFWFTGADNGKHRLRLYFDGEREPSLDTTIGDFCGGQAPFIAPVSLHQSFGWYSYLPIPFRKRLVVMAQEGNTRADGWPRLFYQINYSRLPKGQTIESFKQPLPSEVADALDQVRMAWRAESFAVSAKALEQSYQAVARPGEAMEPFRVEGPGVIQRLAVEPDLSAISSYNARRTLLRDLVLRIEWDDAGADSVAVPLGPFFGGFHGSVRYDSMFLGMEGGQWFTRFPMPFKQVASVRVENRGSQPVPVRFTAQVAPRNETGEYGYFHAAWESTSPREVGRPHPIVLTQGKGRLAGCMLSVTSLDRSWWVLEGDETVRIDGETSPSWKGTGLEDYFNGAWYYQNPVACPLNGLLFKAPFRTVQYRMHLPDPILFDKDVHMQFERGPDHASRAWFESVGYYYLAAPAAAKSLASIPKAPEDPLAKGTLMFEVLNYERLGDYKGAEEKVREYMEGNPEFPFNAVLEARLLGYRIREEGFETVRPALEAFINSQTNEMARKQAEDLLWVNDQPDRALLGTFFNTPARVFLDGKMVAQGNDKERLQVTRLEVPAGEHQLALQARWSPYPSWAQIGILTPAGVFGTQPDWLFSYDPSSGFTQADFDDSNWKPMGGTGVKGPPEVPYIWVEPNAYIGIQSQTAGMRPREEDWPDKRGTIVYRTKWQSGKQ
jgi:hypothetical protein